MWSTISSAEVSRPPGLSSRMIANCASSSAAALRAVADPVGLRGVELAAELDRGDLGVGRLRERLRRPEQRQREQAESGNEGEGAGAHDRIIRRFAKGTYEGLSAYFSMSASRAA